jgi:hypothetical protein
MFNEAESHVFLFAAQCFNTESMAQVCVNTLPTTKVTLITDGV